MRMYRKFGKEHSLKRAVLPFAILFCMIAVPISIFFVFWVIESTKPVEFITGVILAATPLAVTFIHVKNIYVFPPVEIDNYFLVINQPFQKRSVFTILSRPQQRIPYPR